MASEAKQEASLEEDEPEGAGEMPAGSGRRPKSKKQKKAAAGYSQRHRETRKAAGVPTGRQIDTASAACLIQLSLRPKGIRIEPHRLPELRSLVIRREGWDANSKDVERATDTRINRLANSSIPLPTE